MKKDNVRELLERIEGKFSPSDKFHIKTNNKKLTSIDAKDIPESWVKIHFKTYPRLNRIKLGNIKSSTSRLNEVIRKRRSIRQFSGLPISKNELSYLLFASCGLINSDKSLDDSRRPYPSAGARYPLELYPIILNCTGVKNGLYHYNVKENSLELLLEKDLKNWIIKATGGGKWIADASAIFIITGILDRTRIKYSDRGYRYILIEAGHLGQNICLLASELGLGNCPLGGYIDDEINKLLDISFQKEVSLYLIAIGKQI